VTGSLDGEVVLVTGGSRGIGRAVALALADAGADVAITYRERAEAADAVLADIRAAGRRAVAVQADLGRSAEAARVVGEVTDALGPIEVLVNNAGVLQQKPFAEITEEDLDRVLDVNLKSVFLLCQAVMPPMLERGRGRIVNVASSGGQLGGTLAAHYSASKAGVIGLTRSLARIGAPDVAVNCVSPGLIETEMTEREIASSAGRRKLSEIPLARTGRPDEVAEAVLFLATSAPYVTGHTLNVNGGLYLG
jgi:NAD(P)-dependent dehydrogenase (short-subunit alcohol dehydrogenase family)